MTTPDSRGRSHSPAVTAQAERLGVDLGAVDGTGAGGRVTMANVLAAVPKPALPPTPKQDRIRAQEIADYRALFGSDPLPDRLPPRPSAAHRKRPINVRSAFSNNVQVTIDAHGRNPLLEDVAQTHPCYPLAIQEAEPPTLFRQGDLPKITASGVEPQILLELPWQVRHYAAQTESRAEVLNLVEKYADDPTVIDGEHNTDGALDYVARMRNWLIGPREDTLAVPGD